MIQRYYQITCDNCGTGYHEPMGKLETEKSYENGYVEQLARSVYQTSSGTTIQNKQELQEKIDEELEMLWAGIMDNPFVMEPRVKTRNNLLQLLTDTVNKVLDELTSLAEPNQTTPAGEPELVPLSAIEQVRKEINGE